MVNMIFDGMVHQKSQGGLTVRQLAEKLLDIPERYQDMEVVATYDGFCVTPIFDFDPAALVPRSEGYESIGNQSVFLQLPSSYP